MSDHADRTTPEMTSDAEPSRASGAADVPNDAGEQPRPIAAAAEPEPAISPDLVKAALRRVKDPELNLNIVDLGLVYDIRVEGAIVDVDMSLTSPGCPSGPEIMTDAEQQIRAMAGVEDVKINLVWSPFWTPDRIEPRIRAYLGI